MLPDTEPGHVPTELELRRIYEQMVATLENMSDAFYAVDQTWRFTYINQKATQLWGIQRETLLGRNIWEAFPEAVGSPPYEAHLRAVHEQRTVTFTEVSPVLNRWIEGSICPNGAGLAVYFRDISERKQAEAQKQELIEQLAQQTAELDAQRAYWQAAVSGIADEVWLCNLQGQMSLINLPDSTHMGLTPFQDKPIQAIMDEVDILTPDGQLRPVEDAPLLRALQGDVVQGEEIMRHRQTGQQRYRQFSAAPVQDAKGTITGAIAIVRDVTQQKQVEQALQESEARYRFLVDTIPQIIWTATPDGKQDFANRRWYEFNGLEPRTTPPDAWRVITHPDDVAQTEQAWASALQTGEPYSVLHRIRRWDGVYRWTLTQAIPQKNQGGHIIQWLGAGTDVTELHQAEEALRAAHEQTVEILESISDAFYAVDRDWRFTYVNRKTEELWNKRRDSLIGQSVWDVFPQSVGTPTYQAMHRAADEHIPIHFETHSAILNTWIEINVYPAAGGLSVYFRDITERKQAEETITQQASLLEQSHDAIFVWELGTRIRQWYRGAEELYGWSRDEVIGRDAQELLHTESPLPWEQLEAKLVRNGRWEGKLKHTTRDGRRITVESRLSLATYREGLQVVLEVNRDITQRLAAELRATRLQEITAALTKALTPTEVAEVILTKGLGALGAEAGSVALLTTDGAALNVIRSVGYPTEMTMEWSSIPLHSPVPLADAVRMSQPVWLGSLAQLAAVYPHLGTVPTRTNNQAAAAVPLVVEDHVIGALGLSFAMPQLFSEIDQAFILTLAGYCAQTIQRAHLYEEARQAQRQNAEHARRLAVLADASRAFAEHNREPQKLFDTITERLATLVGDGCALRLLSEDMEQMELVSLFHPDPATCQLLQQLSAQVQQPEGMFKTVIETGKSVRIPVLTEEQYRRAVPPHLHQYFHSIGAKSSIFAPLRRADRIIGVLALSRLTYEKPYVENDEHLVQDLASRAALAIENARLYQAAQMNTETLQQQVAERTQELQQAMERAQQADRLKSSMLSTVSHEMRTPMGSIIGFTDLMLQRTLDQAKVREYAQLINTEARRLARLINDFLDLHRMQQDRQSLRLAPTNLPSLIQDVIAKNRFGTDGRHLLRLNVSPISDLVVDSERIQQVMVNLLSNAIKYSPDGGAVIITVYQQDTEVIVSVQDSGLGIPADELQRLFEEFYRGSAAEELRIKGTGLGLALCKQIIQAHHGRIWAESAGAGQGTTFSFALPIAYSDKS